MKPNLKWKKKCQLEPIVQINPVLFKFKWHDSKNISIYK